jgi:hypothetical protein
MVGTVTADWMTEYGVIETISLLYDGYLMRWKL